jgi:hypothetical protein
VSQRINGLITDHQPVQQKREINERDLPTTLAGWKEFIDDLCDELPPDTSFIPEVEVDWGEETSLKMELKWNRMETDAERDRRVAKAQRTEQRKKDQAERKRDRDFKRYQELKKKFEPEPEPECRCGHTDEFHMDGACFGSLRGCDCTQFVARVIL